MEKLANISTMPTLELEDRIRRWMKQIGEEHPKAFGCNLPCELVSCDADRREIVYCFFTVEEMENPWGVTHGGMLAVMLDWAMGVAARTILDYNHTPTVDMQLQYLKPVPLNTKVYVRARVNSRGKRIAFMSAHAWCDREDNILTNATGVYYLREEHLILR